MIAIQYNCLFICGTHEKKSLPHPNDEKNNEPEPMSEALALSIFNYLSMNNLDNLLVIPLTTWAVSDYIGFIRPHTWVCFEANSMN